MVESICREVDDCKDPGLTGFGLVEELGVGDV